MKTQHSISELLDINFKRLCQLLFTFILFASVNAQTYLPLIENEKTWSELGYIWPDGNWTDFYSIGNNTIINDSLYYELLFDSNRPDISLTLFGYLRETTSGQVYFRPFTKSVKTFTDNEYLIYNFSSLPGDTLEVYSVVEQINCQIVIDSIVVGQYFNINRRQYYYHLLEGSMYSTYFIEGIGSSQGLFQTCMNLIDAGSELLCTKIDTSLLYYNPYWHTCEVPSTVGIKENVDKIYIYIIPNPSNGIFMIKSYKSVEIKLMLYSLFGGLLEEITCSTNSILNFKKYSKSYNVLIYKIYQNNQIIKTGKLLLD